MASSLLFLRRTLEKMTEKLDFCGLFALTREMLPA